MRLWPPLVCAALASCGGCEPVVGPEGEVARFLEAQRGGCAVAVEGRGTLALTSLKFDRLLVKPEGEGLTAVATFDGEGVFKGVSSGRIADEIPVSYLGLERAPFVRREGRWAPQTSVVPALVEIVALLDARREALGKKDAAALDEMVAKGWKDARLTRDAALEKARALEGRYQPTKWIVRVEREGAQVLEEYTLEPADGPARRGQVRFELKREDGRLRFASGLL